MRMKWTSSSIQPTYEELKRQVLAHSLDRSECIQPTYEELKRTKDELKRKLAAMVSSLPMRN